MCRSKLSSTEWMPRPNYLWIHSVVCVYQNERTGPPFSQSVPCQRPDRPAVSFRVKNIKHIFSLILSSFFHAFFFIVSFYKKMFLCIQNYPLLIIIFEILRQVISCVHFHSIYYYYYYYYYYYCYFCIFIASFFIIELLRCLVGLGRSQHNELHWPKLS
jgi:hypothetical protein